MKVYARFGEILSKTLKDLKETKCYGRTDNVKTVYPPTFVGGIKHHFDIILISIYCFMYSNYPMHETNKSMADVIQYRFTKYRFMPNPLQRKNI